MQQSGVAITGTVGGNREKLVLRKNDKAVTFSEPPSFTTQKREMESEIRNITELNLLSD